MPCGGCHGVRVVKARFQMVIPCPEYIWPKAMFEDMVRRIKESTLNETMDPKAAIAAASEPNSFDRAILFSILNEAYCAGNA